MTAAQDSTEDPAQRKDPQDQRPKKIAKLGLWAGGVITAMVIAAATVIGNGFGHRISPGPPPSASPAARPQIEVDDLLVNPPNNPSSPMLIDIKLRNIGDQLTIVKRAVLTIRRSAPLPVCLSQGILPLSNTYGAFLPISPAPNQQVTLSLSDQIPAGQADRFELALRLPPLATRGQYLYLYSIDISLLHDASSKAVNAGHVILLMPDAADADQYFLTRIDNAGRAQISAIQGPGAFTCLRSNATQLREFLSLPGARAQELTNVLSQLAG